VSEFSASDELNRCFSGLTEGLLGNLAINGLTNYLPSPIIIEVSLGDHNTLTCGAPEIFQPAAEKVKLTDVYPPMAGPVGAYGRDWTMKLLATGANLMEAATRPESPTNILPAINDFEPWEQNVFDLYTYRQSRKQYRPIPNYNKRGEDMTVKDGIQALAFTSILFTSHKMPGYEDPRPLLTELAASGAYSAFALKVPFSLVTRMAREGTMFAEPPIIKRNEKWRLHPELLQHFDEGIASGKYSRAVGNIEHLDRPGCPVARRQRNVASIVRNSVDSTAEVMARVVVDSPSTELPVHIYGPDDW
jgi:hypothetical protein